MGGMKLISQNFKKMRTKDKFGREMFLAEEGGYVEDMVGKRHTLSENFKVQCNLKRLEKV